MSGLATGTTVRVGKPVRDHELATSQFYLLAGLLALKWFGFLNGFNKHDNMLISALKSACKMIFVIVGQHQASCFPPIAVFML